MIFKYCLYLWPMKNKASNPSILKQLTSLATVLMFCVFVSGVEYLSHASAETPTEKSGENPEQSILKVAVDAVVPFAVQVVDTVFYLISFVFSADFDLPLQQVEAIFYSNSFAEILFEQIISPQGP